MKGYVLGNLLLVGMILIIGDFFYVIIEISKVLNVRGCVLLVVN